jgi:arginyl-tRNA synthetase
MIHIRRELGAALWETIQGLIPEAKDSLAIQIACMSVTPCQDTAFGDYQNNVAMVAAKAIKPPRNPRELAQQIIDCLQKDARVTRLCDKLETAGPGFINFHLKRALVEEQLSAMTELKDAQGAFSGIVPLPESERKKVVLDFCGPNTAKAMHVGHIRSTFLGDALQRMARAVGFQVITDNHLGDWGTQFGKLIYGYKHFLDRKAAQESPIQEFERLYREANTLSEKDEKVLQEARQELVKLQSGDPENLRIWKEISDLSLLEFQKAFDRLGVKFDYQLGESFYNPMLPEVVSELKRLGIAELSEGAICIFFRENERLKDSAPMIIQKADGAFLYATTDLATVRYRVKEWNADVILYVTDVRQKLHFQQLFLAVNKWRAADLPSWGQDRTLQLEHIVFGTILGPDKKPFKTRSGDTVKLNELLGEAEARALKIVQEKNSDLSADEQQAAARTLGYGALKYADLAQNRELDYLFDWDKLLALQGNTAPYLIYAYVRIQSIFRTTPPPASPSFSLQTPEEVALGKHLIQFGAVVHTVLGTSLSLQSAEGKGKEAGAYRPHLLTNYLYELSSRFSRFYENCPVLKAEEPIRSSRLALCAVTAKTLKKGLDLLGIGTLERM